MLQKGELVMNSKRLIDLNTLQNTEWAEIFNTERKKKTLSFSNDHCTELELTHADLRPCPAIDPEAANRTWDSSSMVLHYFDARIMARELERLSQGVAKTDLVPLLSVGGDNISVRTPTTNEWLEVVLLPTDWVFDDQRELEIRWLVGADKKVSARYRRQDTSRTLGGQM